LAFWKRYGFVILFGALTLVIFANNFNITKEPFVQYTIERTLFIIGVAIILLPFVLWHFNHPLPIECEYRKGNYIFTFKNRAYAERFAQMNKTNLSKRV
jgi:hypothetical protein